VILREQSPLLVILLIPYSRTDALNHLLKISTMKPNLIMEITFPAFMATLPDSEEEAQKKPYHVTLEALAKLSIERAVFEVLLTRLLNKLDIVIQSEYNSPELGIRNLLIFHR